MKPPAFVLDTHTLVWFVQGLTRNLGRNAFASLTDPRAQIVIPDHAFWEIQQKFGPKMQGRPNGIRVPPTPLLRLAHNCSNVRILYRDAAYLSTEIRLRRAFRFNGISHQDIAIAAAVIVTAERYEGSVQLVTRDRELTKWASTNGISVIWDRLI